MIADWSTYKLEDFLLFGPETYWRLFALANRDWWPAALAGLLLGVIVLWLLIRGASLSGRWLGLGLAVLWAWVGWSFFIARYAPINPLADYLAALFFVQGTLLVGFALTGRLQCPDARSSRRVPAVALLSVALFVYPLLALIDGRDWRSAELFAVAPDPTIVATFGLLALTGRGWSVVALLIIPTLALLVSSLTLFAMDARQAWFTLAILLAAFGASAWRSGHSPRSDRRVSATAGAVEPLRPENDPTDCRSA